MPAVVLMAGQYTTGFVPAGRAGTVDVIDVVPLQVANCSRKLLDYPWARVRLGDAALPGGKLYDSVCCFFLLHELPDDYKRSVLTALLASVPPGGKAVFVDYHMPRLLHPLRPVLSLIFRFLEPFAGSLWQNGIRDFAQDQGEFIWRKETFFGGMFQKVVAERKTPGLCAISSTE